MSHHLWLSRLAFVFVSSIAFVSVVNMIVDPYGVFHFVAKPHFNIVKRHVASDRMTKLYYLARIKPRALLLGSSTIGSFESTDLERYAPAPAYNLALGGMHIREIHAYLTHAASRYPVKTVVIGLDFFGFFGHDANHELDARFVPERLRRRIYVEDYLVALFPFDTFVRAFKTIHDNRGDQRGFQYVDYETGTFLWNRANTVGPPRHSIDEYRMKQLCEIYSTHWSSRVVENVRYVKKMLEFAESHQIDLRLFASPSHLTSFALIARMGLGTLYARWHRALAEVTAYYDFGGANSITNDAGNFIDTLHLKPEGGRLIFARLFDDRSIPVPADFGVPITQATVDNHLAALQFDHRPARRFECSSIRSPS